ncbi:hypothetical protein N9N03_02530 [Chlamydiia bacterium]|nr:hypothetical protein [Chlamydiia bacterium]
MIFLSESKNGQVSGILNDFYTFIANKLNRLKFGLKTNILLDTGPGFYTGIRVASVFAQTMSIELGVPIKTFSWVNYLQFNKKNILFIQGLRKAIIHQATGAKEEHIETEQCLEKLLAEYRIDYFAVTSKRYMSLLSAKLGSKSIFKANPAHICEYALKEHIIVQPGKPPELCYN